jgi:hypothetical protein
VKVYTAQPFSGGSPNRAGLDVTSGSANRAKRLCAANGIDLPILADKSFFRILLAIRNSPDQTGTLRRLLLLVKRV